MRHNTIGRISFIAVIYCLNVKWHHLISQCDFKEKKEAFNAKQRRIASMAYEYNVCKSAISVPIDILWSFQTLGCYNFPTFWMDTVTEKFVKIKQYHLRAADMCLWVPQRDRKERDVTMTDRLEPELSIREWNNLSWKRETRHCSEGFISSGFE